MIKRNVNFTVAADGTVEPRIPQYGGVKGEHNATMCRIVLLDTAYEGGDRLRLSFTTGDGTYLSTEHMEEIVSTDGGVCVEYALPQAVTVGAGQLCMRAVLVRLTDGEEKEVARSGEMVLYFDEATVENGTPFWTGVSQMLERTVTAKDAAVGAQSAATEAALRAIAHRDHAYESAVRAQEYKNAAVNADTSARAAKEAACAYADAAQVQATEAKQYATGSLHAKQLAEEAKDMAVDNAQKAHQMMMDCVRYRGSMVASQFDLLTDVREGDLVFVTSVNQFFFCYDGTHWRSLAEGVKGEKGDSYILTDADKMQIAAICKTLIEDGNGVEY